ncbi:hypothetical protein PFBG_06153 [Plasmodium falciparum 7G8]|uniref:Uncharacterized protein n=3 Tax=Plasmodium falciparum TaxID=5833 RepID=A0A024WDE2_PLAFA|nr:hypothetical protein PFTANZ_00453 [Plasmodium falciparum Tanzania (2000708)]ETW45089.1 hypothetical protein PFNF135_00418 [Plasmodium falciparum NF135/5.C10]EUR48458.1 hypothetical protein PFBG_06153 [Plasmodium falciparum 7G8]
MYIHKKVSSYILPLNKFGIKLCNLCILLLKFTVSYLKFVSNFLEFPKDIYNNLKFLLKN